MTGKGHEVIGVASTNINVKKEQHSERGVLILFSRNRRYQGCLTHSPQNTTHTSHLGTTSVNLSLNSRVGWWLQTVNRFIYILI